MRTLVRFAAGLGVLAGLTGTVFSKGVTRLDTVYTPPGYEDGSLVASIFIPDSAVARGIGVVLGHYLTGNRLTARVWCDTLAARGYTAMTIDYYDIGGPPYGLYPKPVRAFKIAIEFLRRNATRFGIWTNKVAGFGQSQGSMIWGETIIWDNDDAYFRTDSTIDDHLDAAILLYGAYDNFRFSLDWEKTLVSAYFSRDSALRATKGQCIANIANITTPLLLIHGTTDVTLSIAHSRILRDSLVSHGRVCELLENNSDHGFDMSPSGSFTAEGLRAKDAVLSFLDAILNPTSVVRTFGEGIPVSFSLFQNYPNPFNPSTVIRYQLPAPSGVEGPAASHVRLAVYDMLGREVAVLVNEKQAPGGYEVQFGGSNLSSGVYLYRLTAGQYAESRRMLLLK